MAKFLRQSTATTVEFGPLVDASDGYTYKSSDTTIGSATGNIFIIRADNTATCVTGAVPVPFAGWARVSLGSAQTNVLGPFMLRMGNITDNLPVWSRYTVLSANVYDSLISPGTDFLQVDVMQVTGAAPSSAAIGSVANLTTGVAVSSIAAGIGVNVSSINAAVGVNVSSINSGAATNIMFNANLIQILASAVTPTVAQIGANVVLVTGAAPSNAAFLVVSQVNAAVATAVAVGSIAAGVGVNVSSMGVGVNVTAINGAAPTNITFNANLVLVTGAAPSDAIPNFLNYIVATPLGQTLTVKDYLKNIGAAVAGRSAGATSAVGMIFYGPSGEARVSGTYASGNRLTATWVTG